MRVTITAPSIGPRYGLKRNSKIVTTSGSVIRLNPVLSASGITAAHVPIKAMAKYVASGWRCTQPGAAAVGWYSVFVLIEDIRTPIIRCRVSIG